jgi:hypothetical protein
MTETQLKIRNLRRAAAITTVLCIVWTVAAILSPEWNWTYTSAACCCGGAAGFFWRDMRNQKAED